MTRTGPIHDHTGDRCQQQHRHNLRRDHGGDPEPGTRPVENQQRQGNRIEGVAPLRNGPRGPQPPVSGSGEHRPHTSSAPAGRRQTIMIFHAVRLRAADDRSSGDRDAAGASGDHRGDRDSGNRTATKAAHPSGMRRFDLLQRAQKHQPAKSRPHAQIG